MLSGLFGKKEPEEKEPSEPVYRIAKINDIKQMHRIRISVKENKLSDPALITAENYREFISVKGKGWVCEVDEDIVGFAVADLQENNIWALFVLPEFQGKGIGKKLHTLMMTWYFSQTDKTVWLSTSPGTRAEKFYRMAGWIENGIYGEGEIKFEFKSEIWTSKNEPGSN